MKQNTFDPCKDHENGHFGWCLLCENQQLRNEVRRLENRCRDLYDKIPQEKESVMHEIVSSWCK